jgi:anti-sigma B factor antagonist
MSACGRRKVSSTLGAEGMDFKAAAESFDGGIHVVSVAGELDLATRPALERVLRELPDDGVSSLIVDLTACSFMGSTGLHLLVRTKRQLDRLGGTFAIASANRAVLKVFEITELDRLFAIYPTRAAALRGDGDRLLQRH